MRPVTVAIPRELIDALSGRVTFDSDEDVAAFVADAMRVYADLGRLCQGKGQLIWQPEDGPPRRVRLPAARTGQELRGR